MAQHRSLPSLFLVTSNVRSKVVFAILTCTLVLAGFLTSPVSALADTSVIPTWWNGHPCNNDSNADVALTDTTLGLQICYPHWYDGKTQPNTSETGAGSVSLLEWQCVELSARYLAEHESMPNGGSTNGYDLARNYFKWYQPSRPDLSMIYSNDTSNGHPTTIGTFPSVGDVYSTSSGGTSDGHTGVVASVNITNAAAGNATLTIDQQNTDSGHSGTPTSHDWPTGYLAINGWSYAQSAYDGGGPQNNVEILHFGAGTPPPPPPTQLAAPTSVYDPLNNETEFAARGADNKMYFATQDGKKTLDGNSWITGWGSTPGATFAGNPIGIYDAKNKEIEFAARGLGDNKIYFATQDATTTLDGASWIIGWYSTPSSVTFVGNPTVVYDIANDEIAFGALGNDKTMYFATQDGKKTLDGNDWLVGWNPATGASLAGDPVGIYDDTTKEIEFAARGVDNKMYFVTEDATKTPLNGASWIIGWYGTPSSVPFAGNPTVVYDYDNANNLNQIEFSVIGADGKANFVTQDGTKRLDGGSWTVGWNSTPGGPFATSITS